MFYDYPSPLHSLLPSHFLILPSPLSSSHFTLSLSLSSLFFPVPFPSPFLPLFLLPSFPSPTISRLPYSCFSTLCSLYPHLSIPAPPSLLFPSFYPLHSLPPTSLPPSPSHLPSFLSLSFPLSPSAPPPLFSLSHSSPTLSLFPSTLYFSPPFLLLLYPLFSLSPFPLFPPSSLSLLPPFLPPTPLFLTFPLSLMIVCIWQWVRMRKTLRRASPGNSLSSTELWHFFMDL